MSQSKGEKQKLHAAWKAHPKVVAFESAVRDHVAQAKLSGLDGMNDVLRFSAEWLRVNGDLPDSGVLSD
jgi:hypothetical protein